jgi:hypothetical protein
VMIPLFGRVPGRASRPSRTRVDNGSVLQYFSWMEARAFRVFPMKWIYRQKGEIGGRPRGPHHGVAQPGATPRHHLVWPARGSFLSFLWTPSSCQVNRNFDFCFI